MGIHEMGVQEAGAILRRRSQNVDGDRARGWVSSGYCEGSRRENREVGRRGCQTLELELSSVVMGNLPRRLKQGVMKS